ncbi:hypothetical protein EVAR_44126_1 [Eumeta japonica]|uniref:Uncharacterized protein n=1 Tax=Eumeta variegata TaxID=151549 RepID=A0A4C1XLM8_EUMVA|nr:hypothetical protein EVAR_44126_1 [Eumeta japonica]
MIQNILRSTVDDITLTKVVHQMYYESYPRLIIKLRSLKGIILSLAVYRGRARRPARNALVAAIAPYPARIGRGGYVCRGRVRPQSDAIS